MDFASLMKSQIGSPAPKSSDGGGAKKYMKRSEIEAQRQADYRKEQEERENARLERLEKKRKRDEEDAEEKRVREEKRRKLAEESKRRAAEEAKEEQRVRRKRLGLPELEDVAAKDGEVEDGGEEKAVVAAPKMSNGPIPTTLELVPEAEMKVPSTLPPDEKGQKYLLRQIASYFDMLLSEWNLALSRRSREVKESLTGRKALQSYETALSNLTPLFRKMESGTLASSLLPPLLEITHLAQSKRYVDANDAYLRLSIGKAAWPIGVTMVGIHERSAREKLHESEKDQKANILADETTRKMLQGIKRCLSFAQTRWPPEDLGQLMG